MPTLHLVWSRVRSGHVDRLDGLHEAKDSVGNDLWQHSQKVAGSLMRLEVGCRWRAAGDDHLQQVSEDGLPVSLFRSTTSSLTEPLNRTYLW